MNKVLFFSAAFLLTLIINRFNLVDAAVTKNIDNISGSIQQGYRVLTINGDQQQQVLRVFRGDYIKFSFDESMEEPTISIPALSISQKIPATLRAAPYFKMKNTGEFQFTLGKLAGLIQVIEYDKPQYQAVTSEEAALLITNLSPVILDVRTTQEYATGHLENSVLIPVQQIQRRFGELSQYKDDHILIYCATGNRSTVAAKILIDNGFKRIFNLREGVHVWANKGNPIVR